MYEETRITENNRYPLYTAQGDEERTKFVGQFDRLSALRYRGLMGSAASSTLPQLGDVVLPYMLVLLSDSTNQRNAPELYQQNVSSDVLVESHNRRRLRC